MILSNTIPTTNEDINSTVRVNINNPFWEINTPFSIEIKQPLTLTKPNSCLTNYISGEKTTIFFNCLDFGNNTLDFFSKFIINTVEKEKIIYATTDMSLIQKNIKLITESTFPKLLITTNKTKKSTLLLMIKKLIIF